MKIISLCIALLLCSMACKAINAKPVNVRCETTASERVQEISDSVNVILDKAKAGDDVAMNEVGTWYYTGKHVNRNYSQAYEWWKRSALKGNMSAIANFGLCYQFGHGVEKDTIGALRLYEKSVKMGNTVLLEQREANASKNAFDAIFVGNCYSKGVGVPKDYVKAAESYAMAAAQGSVDGMRHAGLNYLNAKQNTKALPYFKQGAEKGDSSCEFWAGKMLLGGMRVPADMPQAVVYLLKAAESGMPAAQTEMGSLYASGNGVTENAALAAEWYRKAAFQGDDLGMWNYGNVLKNGNGVARDYGQALHWMSEAASAGYRRTFKRMIAQLDSIGSDPFAYYVHGMKYYLVDNNMNAAEKCFKKLDKAGIEDGKIMRMVMLADTRASKPNANKAAKELEKLARIDAEAAFYLAEMYENGNGVVQDNQKAIELYRKSADMGNGKAQSILGDIYYEGRGTAKDDVTAIKLYCKALENRQLSQRGIMRLAECYEGALAGLPVDVHKARQLRKLKYVDNIIPTLKLLDE